MPARLRRSISLKLVFAFTAVLGALVAQDPTSYLTPGVMRVGDRLACRCGGCRNTVGNCPMLRCSSADPMRRRIHQMQMTGMSDQDVVNNIVREEGAVALATPPTDNFGGILTWVMPGVALVIGFFIWSAYVRRNQKAPEVISDADRATIEKYRAEIDDELDEGPQTH
ncbi:MAG TPA: cytochrome c-type biogenesis protein CcmH [Bryobacteraceae bacterium]|nr:cytochrome c-type biogenesis protein CcmH [Bryobacteraceae bacterium]